MFNDLHIVTISFLYGENYDAADDLVAGYIVAVLRREGYSMDFIEITKENENEKLNDIINSNYQIVFLTIPTTSNLYDILAIAKKIKAERPYCRVVLAGWDHHSAPINQVQILEKNSYLDIIICGEGELTVIDLVSCIYNNKTLRECPGIIYRHHSETVITPKRDIQLDLDQLPFPARDTQAIHNYKSFRISGARGCRGHCTFCPMSVESAYHEKKWRGRSPESVVAEIKELVCCYHIRHFMFMDPIFEGCGEEGKKRIKRIAEMILEEKLKINFLVNMRADNWSLEDYDLLQLLYRAGLESVTVGIESGNQEVLKRFNKCCNLADYDEFIKLMDSFNIYLAYGFIMFEPYSFLDEIKCNNEFLKKAGIGYMMGAYWVRLKAFSKTPFFNKMVEDNLIDADSYSLYDYQYIDSRVKRLSQKMQMVKIKIEGNTDIHFDNIQKINTYITRARREYDSNHHAAGLLSDYINEIERAFKDLKRILNVQNYLWFKKCIEWAEYDGNDSEFDETLERHIIVLRKAFKDMKNTQMKYGKKIVYLSRNSV